VRGDPKLDLRMRPTDRMVARPSQTIGRAHGALSPHGSNLVFLSADVLLNLRHHRRSVLGLDLLSFSQQGVPSVPDEVGPLLQLLLARVEDPTLARTGAYYLCSDALNPKGVFDVSLSKLGLDTGWGDSIEILRKHERFHRRRRVVPRGLRRSRPGGQSRSDVGARGGHQAGTNQRSSACFKRLHGRELLRNTETLLVWGCSIPPADQWSRRRPEDQLHLK
jgi:hypothetical protein